uniref:Uncharacterized protein n=1 Tax=Opuntia streptacantha TaxID=393608 RepID=A0A7C9CPQ9_OPUST
MRVPALGLPRFIVLGESERREKVRPPVAATPSAAPSAVEEVAAAAAEARVKAEEEGGGGGHGSGFGKQVAEKGFGCVGFGLGRRVGIGFRIGKGFGILRGERGVYLGW